jgi:hypothetical protein
VYAARVVLLWKPTTAFCIHLLALRCSNILDWLVVNGPRPKNSETNKSKLEIQAVRRKRKGYER